jgi:hypothetical protein
MEPARVELGFSVEGRRRLARCVIKSGQLGTTDECCWTTSS